MKKKQIIPDKGAEGTTISTPAEAENLCSRLIETTTDLVSVLERETQLVRKAIKDDFTALTARKHALSITLMRDMDTLKSNAAYISNAVPEKIRLLREQQNQFHRSLEINHSALSAMKAVSEELLQTIAAKAAKRTNGPQVYNNEANLNTTSERKAGPVSLDTIL